MRQSILVKNPENFSGGQDAKTFVVVKQADIDSMKTPLTSALAQSMHSAIQGQLRPGQQLLLSQCSTTLHPNHHANDIAASVTLTATQTCTGLAYTPQQVKANALRIARANAPNRHFILTQAMVTLGKATLQPIPTVTVAIHGIFIYAFHQPGQTTHRKTDCRIAGK